MAPEYGATCGFFPIDKDTIDYLEATGRDKDRIALVEAYAKAQGMYREDGTPDPVFTDTLELDLSTVVPSLAGPKRPQDRVALTEAATKFVDALAEIKGGRKKSETPQSTADSRYMDEGAVPPNTTPGDVRHAVEGAEHGLADGDVVIAAITSCTNTSNPNVLVAAGLVARKAHEKGLKVKPWVKTSLAPGSQVVTEYLDKADLQKDLDALGFNLVGYGCTTCIGNSGPLPEPISEAITQNDLVACSVLSGNRNFEGRVNPDVRANYLASPPLVVAYALAGSMFVDITKEPLGQDQDGNDVYLKDIWPTTQEIAEIVRKTVTRDMFETRYADVFKGDEHWQKIDVSGGLTYDWDDRSTYVQNPPYFEGMKQEPEAVQDVKDARILGLFKDSITTDHISPAGSIKKDGPAGDYLVSHQVRPVDFNSYGARRGNHEVMMRGTFANIRIKNEMVPGVEGGVTCHQPSGAADADLRRGDEVQGRGRPARHLRRQGIRHRFVARLGGQGHRASRRACGHCRELRAHPPLQPRRHGRRALRLRGGRHFLAVARHQGRREGDHRRPDRTEAAPDPGSPDRGFRRFGADGEDPGPHRYAGRVGILPQRRHPAVRPAPPCRLMGDLARSLWTA